MAGRKGKIRVPFSDSIKRARASTFYRVQPVNKGEQPLRLHAFDPLRTLSRRQRKKVRKFNQRRKNAEARAAVKTAS